MSGDVQVMVYLCRSVFISGFMPPASSGGEDPSGPADRPGQSEGDSQSDGLALAEERTQEQVKRPPLFRVFLLNDDYTPMAFVVDVLRSVFQMNEAQATEVMLHVHRQGRGLCGVFPFEVAETRVAQVHALANRNEHPLRCPDRGRRFWF